jgi:hypothetical protein
LVVKQPQSTRVEGASIVMKSSGIGPVSTLPITAFAKHMPNDGEHRL